MSHMEFRLAEELMEMRREGERRRVGEVTCSKVDRCQTTGLTIDGLEEVQRCLTRTFGRPKS
jgi:hypothetical protein